MTASRPEIPASKNPDRRRIKAKGSYLLLWFAALTGVIFGLIALSWG